VHGPVTPAQAQALGRVQQAQARLLALVDDVLDFARLEAGQLAYSILPVPLAAVIAEVTALVEPQVRARGLVLEVAPPDGHAADGCSAALVSADRERLGQVLLNLVSNALKFTPPRRADGTPGRITVGVATRDEVPELIFLRVEDTGIGIPRHRQAAIFDPFVQAETGHTRPHDGVGLGLAISRDLARGMGGDLRVRSVPGEGTTFTVTLRRVLPAD
jgi:signal transduction histidine kinase